MIHHLRKLILAGALIATAGLAYGQEPVYEMMEQWMEENTDIETSDEYLDNYESYRDNRININDTTCMALLELNMLSEMQWNNLKSYIEHYGALQSINELELINGFDAKTLQRIYPIITAAPIASKKDKLSLKKMLSDGNHNMVVGSASAIEEAVGYRNGHYEGSDDRIYMRYYYKYRENLKIQLSAEKQAGEAFYKNGKVNGFGYYGGSLTVSDIGIIKRAVVGQYQLQFGQGVTLWTGFNPYISATTNVCRFGQGIRSAGAFNRNSLIGAAATTSLGKRTELTMFYGHQVMAGMNLGVKWRNAHTGLTLWSDKNAWHGGVNGKWLYKQLTLFGEAGVVLRNNEYNGALLAGGEYLFDNNNRFSFYYRKYSPYYSNNYSATLGQNSRVTNEDGLCMNLHLNLPWNISAYGRVDIFRFPIAKYQVAAPSHGNETYLLLTRPMNPKTTIELCYRNKERGKNVKFEDTPQYIVEQTYRHQAEARMFYTPAEGWSLSTRVIQTWYNTESAATSYGFALSQDIRYKTPNHPLSLSARYVIFDIDNYDSRIFLSESNFIYDNNSSQLMYKGYRFYIWAKYELGTNVSIGLKYSITQYANRTSISSGHNKIEDSHRQSLNAQIRIKF